MEILQYTPLDALSNKLLASKLSLVTTRNSVFLPIQPCSPHSEYPNWELNRRGEWTCIFICGAGHSAGPFKGASFGFRIYLILLWMILSHFISCWNSYYVNHLIWPFNFLFSLIFLLFLLLFYFLSCQLLLHLLSFLFLPLYLYTWVIFFGFLNAPLKQKKSSVLCGDLFLDGRETQGKRGYMCKCSWFTLLHSRNTTL